MTRPSFFKSNPAFLTREELCESFVVHQLDLELLVERIRENTGGSCQHVLVIGTRGTGKTTLILRVAAAVEQDPELSALWYPIRFSEESYEVSSAAEFWLEAVGHLATQTGSMRWKDTYRDLRKERDEVRLHDSALARLLDHADETGKRLILFVENLNMLLGRQISDDEGWTLRHTLLNERRIMLVATATSRFDEIDDADKAFYDLFAVHELEPLDTEECRVLWNAVSGGEAAGRRIRPIQIITGGNPRLLAILASFASQGSLRELVRDLESWVDDHTSYFKANLESLPALERKVYVTLANLWSPSTSREVAQMARMGVNKASALLARLRKRGAITEHRTGRISRYQIAERMYNIYYLMRQHSDRGNRVRAVVDFMILYYEPGEMASKVAMIGDEACDLPPGTRADHFSVYAGILQRYPELRPDAVRQTPRGFFELEEAPAMIKALRACDGVKPYSEANVDLESLIALLERDVDNENVWRQLLQSLPNRPDHPHERLAGLIPRLAHLFLGAGKVSEAMTLARELLAWGAQHEEYFPFVIAFFVLAAAAGYGREALGVLESSTHRDAFEPLVVALTMKVGDECHAPLEVVEIARDILERISELEGAITPEQPRLTPDSTR